MARIKKISVKEFIAWLGGVEEMQPDGWSPTSEQWTVIRDKIKTIKDTDTIRTPAAAPVVMQPTYQPAPQRPSSFIPAPAAPAVVPAPPDSTVMSAAAVGASIKTPDIDSTDGYKSTFD